MEVQTPLVQSVPLMQEWPLPQAGHDEPPQSVSLSVPFFMPSRQAKLVHTPESHRLLTQSVDIPH